MSAVNAGTVAPSIHTPCCVCGSTATCMMSVVHAGRVYCVECGLALRDRQGVVDAAKERAAFMLSVRAAAVRP